MQAAFRSGHRLCMLTLAAAVTGCFFDEAPTAAPAATPAPAAVRRAPPPGELFAMILPDVMDLVVDPAAGVLFAAAAQPASHAAEPRSADAWQAVADASAQLAETGSTLALPALTRGRADWLQWANALNEGATTAGAAARRHDPRSLYAAGMQVRASCTACHARYAPLLEPLTAAQPEPLHPPARSKTASIANP